jgi:eukaryotic-like serine/threonine-protein kinase
MRTPDVPQSFRDALGDRYRIEREIGSGGMATVYLAGDVRHDRRVALKVLRPELAAVIGAERFLAEIRTTAKLQHPHILPLFDSGEAERLLYYVMPFVEGESLRSRLDRETQLPVEDAVRIAGEVAAALGYAHSQGIIHRDIKPENILLVRGQALVADFGIALAVSTAGSSRMTETGLSLGTPHYMSPEQATAQRVVDARCDIYSLGAVLYEMLTGEPPHTGSSAQAVLAALLTEAPKPVTARRRSVPPHVAWAVHTALEKLPADRFRDAGSFAEALRRPELVPATAAFGALLLPGRRGSRSALGAAAAVVLLLAGAGLNHTLAPRPDAPAATRFVLGFPAEQDPAALVQGRQGYYDVNVLALSPDGRHLVHEGPAPDGGVQLWYRPLDQAEARALPGTAGGSAPFFSPDGLRIGFYSETARSLQMVPRNGGAPVTVATGVPEPLGASWGTDGYIYYGIHPPADSVANHLSIARVAATGGAPELLLSRSGANFFFPSALPSGRGLLLSRYRADTLSVAVLSLRTGEVTVLGDGGSPRYVAGRLFVTRTDGVLLAAPFDERALRLTGPFVPVLERLAVDPYGLSGQFTISENGTLAYLEGTYGAVRVVMAGRDGAERMVGGPLDDDLHSAALSPDGRRLALRLIGEDSPLEVMDLQTGARSRLVPGRLNSDPAWTPDGRHVTYRSASDSAPGIYTVPADGSGPPVLLLRNTPDRRPFEVEWSRNGGRIVYHARGTRTDRDIFHFEPAGDTTHYPVQATQADEHSPAISPDGRWVAFVSNEGRAEVYVRPLPGPGGRVLVSTAGGTEPGWSRDGSEIRFRSAGQELVAAAVRAVDGRLEVGERTALFGTRGYRIFAGRGRSAPGPDGEILFTRRERPQLRAIVVLNWFAELDARRSP